MSLNLKKVMNKYGFSPEEVEDMFHPELIETKMITYEPRSIVKASTFNPRSGNPSKYPRCYTSDGCEYLMLNDGVLEDLIGCPV